jgi:hypothetical protein
MYLLQLLQHGGAHCSMHGRTLRVDVALDTGHETRQRQEQLLMDRFRYYYSL